MKESMKEHLNYIDKYINNSKFDDVDKVLEYHLTKISFYQHERLIHLLVTMLFSILTVGCVFYTLYNFSVSLAILCIVFMCLLVPYIFHYYYLENGVQKMYIQYRLLFEKKK